MHDGAAAVGSQGAPSEGDLLSPPPPSEQSILVGRLRRWSSKRQWGYVFSELHSSDLILCASEGSDFAEGDFVLFELVHDERNQPSARNARKATSEEVIAQQAQLATAYQAFYYRRLKVENLPFGGSSSTLANPDAGAADNGAQRGHQRADRYAAAEAPQSVLASQLPPHLAGEAGMSLRPPPPPPVLPPVPAHAAAGGPEAFAAAAQQGMISPSAQAAYHQQLSHQGYGPYSGYVDDRNYSMGYHQGVGGAWTSDGIASTNAMRETALSTTISINDQIPGQGHGVKLLFEAPPLLENGFNAKNQLASSIARDFGDLLRSTHNAFQHAEPERWISPGEDMDMSHGVATWQHHQQWDSSWWGQSHVDQMGHASSGAYATSVGHAGLGHSVLSTQGDGGMYSTS